MNHNYRTLSGEEIRRVACPVCKAPPGSPCTEPANGARREHHHLDRVAVARMAGSQQRSVQRALDAKRRRVAERFYRP
jgi:hypothetical protein